MVTQEDDPPDEIDGVEQEFVEVDIEDHEEEEEEQVSEGPVAVSSKNKENQQKTLMIPPVDLTSRQKGVMGGLLAFLIFAILSWVCLFTILATHTDVS